VLNATDKEPLSKRLADFNWVVAKDKVVWMLLLYMTVSYVTLVKLSLSMFACRLNLDGIEYLESHPEIACQRPDQVLPTHDNDFQWIKLPLQHEGYSLTANYRSAQWFAGFIFTMYGIGVPVVFSVVMYKNRNRLKHEGYLRKYGILTNKVRARNCESKHCAFRLPRI
jgi:hypothetical protein